MKKYKTRYRGQKINFFSLSFIFMLVLIFCAYFYVDISLRPYVKNFAIDQVEMHILDVINQAVFADMKENEENYTDISKILTNSSDMVIALDTDTKKINEIKTNVFKEIEDRIDTDSVIEVNVPLGNIYNSIFTFSNGFDIKVKTVPLTTTKIDFISITESASINQSIHKIIMECVVEIKIILPFEEIDFEVTHNIAILDTIILGEVPESYTYIEDNFQSGIEKFADYSN